MTETHIHMYESTYIHTVHLGHTMHIGHTSSPHTIMAFTGPAAVLLLISKI